MRSAQEGLHLVAATVGFLSFFLLWLTVMWGMFLRNGWALSWVRHTTLLATHTTVALLGLCLAAVHTGAQLAKPAQLFRLMDVLVPFVYWRDPVGTGVGIIGLHIMIAVALSIMLQRWLGYSRWRALHALSYVAFTLVVAHVLISGSDLGRPYLSGAVLGAWLLTVVVWLATTPVASVLRARLRRGDRGRSRGQDVSVDVDAKRCARFGFCEHEAPEVFRLRGDGRLAYRASVPAAQVGPVIRAAEVCPARAITLTRVPTTIFSPGRPAGSAVDQDRPVSPALVGPRRGTPGGIPRGTPRGTPHGIPRETPRHRD